MTACYDDLFADALDRIDRRQERRRMHAVAPLAAGRMCRGGRDLIDFSSNDYFDLSGHPALIERSVEYTRRLGTGAGASRLVTGTRDAHLAIEARVAAFKRRPAALLFASGWQANVAVLPALAKAMPGLKIFADRLIHASLHTGIAAAGLTQTRFRHNDLAHLDELLAGAPDGPRLIVTESVFSMDGDRADLAALAALAKRHDAFLFVDEAHATGVLGPGGAGLSATVPGGVDLVMGTFSKAMGGFGAYVAGSAVLIDWLTNACGGFVFTTAIPPAMLGAIDAALDIVPGMDAERQALAARADRLRDALAALGVDCAGSTTQIVPAVTGSAESALALSARLEEAGMLAAAIRPPTVPPGTSRVRLALRASHADETVTRLVAAIAAALLPA